MNEIGIKSQFACYSETKKKTFEVSKIDVNRILSRVYQIHMGVDPTFV